MVSVVIPTYNRSSTLREAVLSVFNQSYRPIECIIVDDGSTDDTSDVVRTFGRLEYDGFSLRYIYHSNSGAQVSRNIGTQCAAGEFIQYLDSDDLLYPDKLAHQVKFLLAHPEFDGIFGDWEIGSDEKKELKKAHASDDLYTQFLTDCCIANFSFLMRSQLVKKVGGWDPEIRRNQEIDFHIRCLLAGAKFCHEAFVTGLWRIHNNKRISNSTSLDDVIYFYRKMEMLLSEKKMFTGDLQKKIAQIYLWLIQTNLENTSINIGATLDEIIRLDADVDFNKSRIFAILKTVFKSQTAFKCWLYISRLQKLRIGQRFYNHFKQLLGWRSV
jgi:glycosyltransferase involved in cell wall biosynthesis